MIKLIVSDVDGTLVGKNRYMPERNQEAIRFAQEKGVLFAIATGRDKEGMLQILEPYGLKAQLGLVGNGAQVVDETGAYLFETYVPKKEFLLATRILELGKLPYMVYTKTGVYAVNPDWVRDSFIERGIAKHGVTKEAYQPGGILSQMACMRLKPLGDKEAFIDREEVIKVESFSLNIPHIQYAKKLIANMKALSSLSSFNDNMEITHREAQKGIALEKVIEKLGIQKEEVMVIGDALNDLSLFERFKYAYAPSNADQRIKDLAYKIVSDHNDGAVADAIYDKIS